MSAAPVSTKKLTTKAPKMTRKERRHAKEVNLLRERTTPILPATTFKRIGLLWIGLGRAKRSPFRGLAFRAGWP